MALSHVLSLSLSSHYLSISIYQLSNRERKRKEVWDQTVL